MTTTVGAFCMPNAISTDLHDASVSSVLLATQVFMH